MYVTHSLHDALFKHPSMPPSVALETTVLSHGLPFPANRELAERLVQIVAAQGAVASVTGCIDGALRCDLSPDEVNAFCPPVQDDGIAKVTLATLPGVLARRQRGATTVATTMLAAHTAGIRVMATGGIGGVHLKLSPASPPDESGDLLALSRYPIAVVCAGPKAVLDVAATRERLESLGVPVVGFGTDFLPAFYCGSSPHRVDIRCDTPEEVAAVIRARDAVHLPSAVLVVVPLPEHRSLAWNDVQEVVRLAMKSPLADKLTPADVTPYLLGAVREQLGEDALRANVELLEQNAVVAARIAVALTISTP